MHRLRIVCIHLSAEYPDSGDPAGTCTDADQVNQSAGRLRHSQDRESAENMSAEGKGHVSGRNCVTEIQTLWFGGTIPYSRGNAGKTFLQSMAPGSLPAESVGCLSAFGPAVCGNIPSRPEGMSLSAGMHPGRGESSQKLGRELPAVFYRVNLPVSAADRL